MFLRQLTEDEIKTIKKLKEAANKDIKKQRLKYPKKDHALLMPSVDGLPVLIKVDNEKIYLNYDFLKKIERSLNKSCLYVTELRIWENTLTIKYQNSTQKSWMEIKQLPGYQVELLAGIPIIDLKE